MFSGIVQPGGVFTIFGDDKNGTLTKEVEVFVNGSSSQKIHTSCSKPVGPGLVFGFFKVEAATSRNGGAMCPEQAGPCAGGKPAGLTLRYTGEDCSASNNTQGTKTSCSGDPAFADPVHVIVSDGGSKTFFQGDVDLNDTFGVNSTAAGASRFASNTHIEVYDSVGGALLQTLDVHTSCSVPLVVGNQFGSMILEGFELE